MPHIDAVSLLKELPQELKQTARSLLCHVLQVTPAHLHGLRDIVLTLEQWQFLQNGLHKLTEGVPLARIVGKREFWSLEFAVNEATLDPRPDSEIVVQTVLQHANTLNITSPRILDLGTGTGCLIISVLRAIPHAQGVAVDVSLRALEAAAANAQTHGVADRLQLVQSDWLEAVEGSFDVIISNPPYIASAEIALLDDNVKKFDPLPALDGGEDGLEAYRAIIAGLPQHMNLEAVGFFEIGWLQAQLLTECLYAHGYRVHQVVQDLEKRDRVVVFSRAPTP